MRGVQPHALTDEELARYSWLAMDDRGLPLHYANELLRRFEKRLGHPVPAHRHLETADD